MQTWSLSLFGRSWVVALGDALEVIVDEQEEEEEESDAGGDLDALTREGI